jgi:hypothetical protein
MSYTTTGVFPFVYYPYLYSNGGGTVQVALRWHYWKWTCLYPPASGHEHQYRIEWGDGTSTTITLSDPKAPPSSFHRFYSESDCSAVTYWYSIHSHTYSGPGLKDIKIWYREKVYDYYAGTSIGDWYQLSFEKPYVYTGGPSEDTWDLGQFLVDFDDTWAVVPFDRDIQVGDQVLVYPDYDGAGYYLIKPTEAAVGDRCTLEKAIGAGGKGVWVVLPTNY